MADEGITTVTLRNKFYKDNYRRVIMILLLSLLVNVGLGILIFWIISHPPEPKYFATSINGRITPLFPLDKPNQSDSAVLQWANQAAIATYSYNFVNYREELESASEFFTPTGWREFLSALQASNMLSAVKAKKLIVSAVATRAPIVLDKGELNGRYAWRVQMPILATYQSASQFDQENYVVTMLITRVATLNSPRGIGIEQFVVAPAAGGISP